jgi:DNA-binding Xre family transcriptional regulator
VSKVMGYRWHLRLRMAERGMFATTDLGPLLAERGVVLSREQVYRLVTGVPERLSLRTLAALCDILDCTPADLVEPVAEGARASRRAAAGPAAAPAGPADLRPVRARIISEAGEPR